VKFENIYFCSSFEPTYNLDPNFLKNTLEHKNTFIALFLPAGLGRVPSHFGHVFGHDFGLDAALTTLPLSERESVLSAGTDF
jgi:hypothetical protein